MEGVAPFSIYLGTFFNSDQAPFMLFLASVILYWGLLLAPSASIVSMLERKLGANVQMRLGPNRTKGYGFFYDVICLAKAILKSQNAFKERASAFEVCMTFLALFSLLLGFLVVPFSTNWVLFVSSSSLHLVICAMVASSIFIALSRSWRSGFDVLVSSMRRLSALSAFLIPTAMSVLSVVLFSGTTDYQKIVSIQEGGPWRWHLFDHPTSFVNMIVFYVSGQIWLSRLPFDFASKGSVPTDSPSVGWSNLSNSLLTVFEKLAVLYSSILLIELFLGGYRFPFDLASLGRASDLVELVVLLAKLVTVGFFNTWLRASLSSLREDQVHALSWRLLVPLSWVSFLLSFFWFAVFKGRAVGEFF